ncbi:MAG TPA: flagellin [Dongiaceae bacterium]|jgi:flagellar hook-associated protein 3 FlgL|nr:flagellin [Dongiaceae bacterium]
MERIATFSQHRQLITQALEVQRKVATQQTQIATGKESVTYQGVAENARTIVNLESELKRADRYVTSGTIVNARVEAMYSAVSQLGELATDIQTWLSSVTSGTGDTVTGVNDQAEAYLEEVAALLNTKQAGSYLFAGSRIDAAPVDLANLSAAPSATAADAGYYAGDAQAASFEAAPDLTITYGVTADEAGFEQLIRALNIARTASEDPADTDALTAAYQLAGSANDDIAVTRTKLSETSLSIERALDSNVDFQLYAESLVDDLQSVDVAAVTAELSAAEAQLEASFNVLSMLQKINLLDYL